MLIASVARAHYCALHLAALGDIDYYRYDLRRMTYALEIKISWIFDFCFLPRRSIIETSSSIVPRPKCFVFVSGKQWQAHKMSILSPRRHICGLETR